MNPQKRRELLDRLEKVAKQDGLMSVPAQMATFCEALNELLMDSVYISIPQDESSDATAPAEVEVAENA